jgi:hypothetical protein
VYLNDRLLGELGLSAASFRRLQYATQGQLPSRLGVLQEAVKQAWRTRAFELHPDRGAGALAEELYKELAQYVPVLLAITPADIPTERAYNLETGRGRLQVVFKL